MHFCIVCDILSVVYQIRNTEGVRKISKLAEARQARGWTQEKLAEVSGVHRVTIARIETGASSPNVDTAKQLANALGVLVDDIIDKDEG